MNRRTVGFGGWVACEERFVWLFKAPLALMWGSNLASCRLYTCGERLARDYNGDMFAWRGLEHREKLEKRLRQALLVSSALKYLAGSAVLGLLDWDKGFLKRC